MLAANDDFCQSGNNSCQCRACGDTTCRGRALPPGLPRTPGPCAGGEWASGYEGDAERMAEKTAESPAAYSPYFLA
jgi:hypothetical protein